MAERNRILMGFRFDLMVALLVGGALLCWGCGDYKSHNAQREKAGIVKPVAADERALSGGDIPVEAWPESWFQPPHRASQIGLTEFKQSPLLDSLVAAGELPPVARAARRSAQAPPVLSRRRSRGWQRGPRRA